MRTKTIRAYIGLGSNIDNPRQQIHTALDYIKIIPKTNFTLCSSLYITPPLPPVIDQPDIINAVVGIDTELTALELLTQLQKIEQLQGRKRLIHWGPRSLDLDLLLYGQEFINLPELKIPHPEMTKRNFVLYPLAEIAGNLVFPSGENLQSLLQLHPVPNKIN